MSDDRFQTRPAEPRARAARVDPAHVAAPEPARVEEAVRESVVLAAAGKCGEFAGPQLVQQASELARHLRVQQKEICRREASLNARLAASDGEQRAARLALREREIELDLREAQLQKSIRQHEAHLAQLDTTQRTVEALDARSVQLDDRERRLAEEEQRLRAMRLDVEQQTAWYQAARGSFQQECREGQQTLQTERARLHAERQTTQDLNARLREQLQAGRAVVDQQQQSHRRAEELDQREAKLNEQAARLEQERTDFDQLRQGCGQRIESQRASLAAHWQKRRSQYQQHFAQLAERGRQLEQRHLALDQLHDVVAQRQREVLELQLAVEQVRAEFDGRVTPAELTVTIERVRGQLADQLALADRTLTQRKQQLRELSAKLHDQHQWLISQRAELQQWVARRRNELKDQATQLIKRERELDQQERQFRAAKRSWEKLRDEYLQPVRSRSESQDT